MRISAALPHGVTAFLFEAARQRRELEGRLVEALEAAGFSEVILPIVDYLEPYEPLLNPASRGELYRFIDRDGELLALRSDFTPMLARLLAPRMHNLELPLHVFYRGDVVRYEEERAGHQRELFQLGAELLGLPGEEAERRMLRLFLELLAVATPGEGKNGDGVRVVLGFAGALDRLLLAAAPTLSPLALAEAVRRRERAVVREIPEVGPTLLAVVEDGAPPRADDLGPDAGPRLERLRELQREIAEEFPRARLSIDLAEFARHPLDPRVEEVSRPAVGASGSVSGSATAEGPDRGYYDGLVFRGYTGTSGQPVGAGGRYDRLFSHLGTDTPAVGFTVGLDRLLGSGSGGAS